MFEDVGGETAWRVYSHVAAQTHLARHVDKIKCTLNGSSALH